MEKKNGEIELFRFIFACCVLCYHLYFDYFKSGWIGVEFFFIVSGILLARSISKQNISKSDAPDFYFNFIKNKILVFYPYYFTIQVFYLIYVIIINDFTRIEVIKKCLAIIPNLLLIEYSGLSSVGMYYFGSWFLSCLILSLCILLPLLLKNYKWSANIAFPLIGIFGLGFIYKNYGTIFVIDQRIFDTIYAGILRGISEIAIGVWGG